MSYTNEYRINVDIKKPTTNVLPTFVQYDSAALIFKIYDNGVEFDLRNFERAEVIHKKPNGSVSYGIGQLVTLENGKDAIKYKYLGGEMNQVGNVLTSLTIFSTDDTKLSVHPFNVKILEDIREDLGDQVREEISFLEQLVEGADGIVADAKIASRRIDEAMQDIYANVSSIEAIAQEESQRQANEITRTQDMSNRIHKGTYSNTVQYYKHNEVLHNGSTYRCLVNSIGIIPTNTSNWTMVSQRGNDGNAGVTSVAGKTGAIVLSASDVGLGNVTNQSKSSMLTSPTLTGTPTAPTAANTTNTTQIATTAFVKSLLAIIETTMGTLTSLTTTVKTSIVAAINSLKSETDTHISNTNVHTTSTEKTTWNAKYTKPTNGIPSSDLTSGVQTSLAKADTALQSVSDASTSLKGIVQLNNTLTSTSTSLAVTAAQAKVLNDNLTSHALDTTKKHIEIVDEIPANLAGKGVFFNKQDGVSNVPNKPTMNDLNERLEELNVKISTVATNIGKNELLERVCFYYGIPHNIDSLNDVEKAAQKFAEFDVVVWSEGLIRTTHNGHSGAISIAARMKQLNPNIQLFGYIPIGIISQGSNLPLSEIASRMDGWKALGATGIFLDEFGYDYLVTRERQNTCIQYARDRGMNVFANSWYESHVFSNESITLSWRDNFDGNPNQIPAIIGEHDYTLFENMLYSYDEEMIDGVRIFSQDAEKVERVTSMLAYTQTPRAEFGGKSWFEHYKTKGVGLDSIINKDEQMYKEAYLLALACGISGYSASPASWGSSSSTNKYHSYSPPLFETNKVGVPTVESYNGVANAKITNTVGDRTINILWNSTQTFKQNNVPQGVVMSITLDGEEPNVGKTWKRPVNPRVGFQYYDTDLRETFIYKGNDLWEKLIPTEYTIETRTTDPISPEIGRIWIREDL